MKYEKPPLSLSEQVNQLIKRGLKVRKKEDAGKVLSEINYYRLSAYFRPFQRDNKEHIFRPNASFNEVLKLYRFDTSLRNILSSIIESAEVFARVRITYHLVTKYKDPFCFTDKSLFSKKFRGEQLEREDFRKICACNGNKRCINALWKELNNKKWIDNKGTKRPKEDRSRFPINWGETLITSINTIFKEVPHDKWLSKMNRSIKTSKEEFVRHYMKTYFEDTGHFPFWMVSEIISFGQLSKLYSGLNHNDKTEIAKLYGLSSRVFGQWLHSIVYLRNMCAHHSRIWNRILEIAPVKPGKSKGKGVWNNRVFSQLLVLKHLTPDKFKWNIVVWKIQLLLWQYRLVDLNAMGFPVDWKKYLK